MNFNDYDLIITTNFIKKEILKNASINKEIIKTKIVTKGEITNLLLGKIDDKAIDELINKFDLPYEFAKVILKNIFFGGKKLKKYYDYLIEKNYLIIDETYLIDKKNVLLINVFLDDFYKNKFKNATFSDCCYEKTYTHEIHEFNTLLDEVTNLAFEILRLKEISFSNIKIVNANDDYKLTLRKIFNMFNIPINLNEKKSIYKMNNTILFLNKLHSTKNIEKSLNILEKDEIYDKLINYFNQKNFDTINEITLKIIEDDIKNINIAEKSIKNAIELINLEDVISDDKYYFVVGFNEGSIPTYYKDEDYYSDKDKKEIGLFTSLDKNSNFKKLFEKIYFSTKNLYISYKLKSSFSKYNISYYINEYNLNVVKEYKNNYSYSNIFNKINLARYLDDLIKFGIVNDDLPLLKSNYDLSYLDYDNEFKGIDNSKYLEKVKEITLSYSSIKDYYECGFKYYINKVLKLNKSEETLALVIGSAFHLVLSKIYDNDFDFEKEYENAFKEYNLSNKDLLFKDILKKELRFIIDSILEFESVTSLKENELEEGVSINDIIPGKVRLYGVIDKFKINKEKNIGIVIDYKTGSVASSLDNINHGLNLQLPIYIYLAKSAKPALIIGGFYLQKVLNNSSLDEDEDKKREKLKLDGYSTTDENILKEIDSGYAGSRFIKSLKLSKNGFYAYSKVLDELNINKVEDIAKTKVLEAAKNIVDAKFDINPKKLKGKNVSCEFCKFKDLCFMKEDNMVEIEHTSFKDLL